MSKVFVERNRDGYDMFVNFHEGFCVEEEDKTCHTFWQEFPKGPWYWYSDGPGWRDQKATRISSQKVDEYTKWESYREITPEEYVEERLWKVIPL